METSDLLRRWGMLLYNSMVALAVVAIMFNMKLWLTDRVEPIPYGLQAGLAVVVLSFVSWYTLLLTLGLRISRGHSMNISWTELIYIIAFLTVTLLPVIWISSEGLLMNPLMHSRVGGFIAMICGTLLILGFLISLGMKSDSVLASLGGTVLDKFLHLPPWLIAPLLGPPLHFNRTVLVDAWSGDRTKLYASVLRGTLEVREGRRRTFSDEELLKLFQDTALSRTEEPNLVASLPRWEEFLSAVGRRTGPLSVLDIGGGEGSASLALLRLVGRAIGDAEFEIDLYESEEMAAAYRSTFGRATDIRAKILHVGKFEGIPRAQRYDVIIAMHSLYSVVDEFRGHHQMGDRLAELQRTLVGQMKPHGVTVVSMASSNGESAEFKRWAMRATFGRFIQDATAEELFEAWHLTGDAVVCDTYFVFPTEQDGQADPETLFSWIRYFARIDSGWVGDRARGVLVENLLGRLHAFGDLPESEKVDILRSGLSEEVLRRTKILPHKTKVVLMSAS